MKLFFETALQAQVFLMALPIGLVMGLCLDLGILTGKVRPLVDILTVLLTAAALILLSMHTMENGLQIYHLLAVVVGILIYIYGIGRAARTICKRIVSLFSQKKKKQQKKEIPSETSK